MTIGCTNLIVTIHSGTLVYHYKVLEHEEYCSSGLTKNYRMTIDKKLSTMIFAAAYHRNVGKQGKLRCLPTANAWIGSMSNHEADTLPGEVQERHF